MLFATLSGQLYFSGNSNLRYGESKAGYLYSESILNGNLSMGAFNAWFQLEYSNPPELGRVVNGLQKFRLEYNTANSVFKSGDIYEIWGRGLVLNQYEDQAVGFDNSLTGVSFRNRIGDLLDWGLLAGNGDIWSGELNIRNPQFNDRVPNYRRQHRVIGADMDWFIDQFTLGASYLQSREKHPFTDWNVYPPLNDTLDVVHRLTGIRAEYTGNIFDMYFEYVDKRTQKFNIDKLHYINLGSGPGFFGNVNMYLGDLAVSLEYKKYAFNRHGPGMFSIVDDYSGYIEYQNPPIVLYEHGTRLLNRISRQVDWNDEVGYQIEMNVPIGQRHVLLTNYSQSSTNNIWREKLVPIDTTDTFYIWEWHSTENTIFLPHTNEFSKPFSELYIELVGHSIGYRFNYHLGIAKTNGVLDIIKHQVTDSTRYVLYDKSTAITLPLALDWRITQRWSIELKYEYQAFYKAIRRINTAQNIDTTVSSFPSAKQYNAFLSFGVSRSPKWSVALLIDASSVLEAGNPSGSTVENTLESILDNIIDLENKWVAVELLWNISNVYNLRLLYGSQQGGILCSNGVCRPVSPFEDGFKMELNALF